MNTTPLKYTVILSAYIQSEPPVHNLLQSDLLSSILSVNLNLDPIRAVGCYMGHIEQSFIIHTNSSHTMSEIKRLGIECYHQECVLVSNNRKHDIQLHNSDATTSHIGHGFKCYTGGLFREPPQCSEAMQEHEYELIEREAIQAEGWCPADS